jgi:hypothetical protein
MRHCMTYCTTRIKIFGVTYKNTISFTFTKWTVSTAHPSHMHFNTIPDQRVIPWNIQYMVPIHFKYHLFIMLNMSSKVPEVKFLYQYSLGWEQ